MDNNKFKMYALTICVKPKPNGICRYSSITFNGISVSDTPSGAKEQSIIQIIESYAHLKSPLITREEITVKSCKLYMDFFNKLDG